MLPTPYVPPHKRVGSGTGSGTGSDSGEVVVAGGCLPAAREGYDVDDARAVVTTTMITFGIVRFRCGGRALTAVTHPPDDDGSHNEICSESMV